MGKKIKVLIIDDSMLFREVLARGLSLDSNISIVARAENPFDAIEKIEAFQPNVITCDVEMPKMNGIEFIRQLMPQYKVPIIVVSAINNSVFDAMDAGAVDFIPKPNIQSPESVENFILELIRKIKEVSHAKIISRSDKISSDRNLSENLKENKNVIAIGASTGGTESIFKILKTMPVKSPGILIVQHIPPLFSKMFADRLNSSTEFEVVEGRTGLYVESGKVIIAPGDQHMRIKRIGDKYRVEVFYGEKVNGHCPSVDVLFESVARECGDKSIGVILTGMGYDGAKGLLSMRRKGARTIGQDEESSVVYGMPKVAYEVGAVERQYSLHKISDAICNLLR